ncbi:MAG: hypothetical protein Q8R32_02655, partial [bacterium]|nr:hypothetical protein [bacterium]
MRLLSRFLIVILAIAALGAGFWFARDRVSLPLTVQEPSSRPPAEFTTLWISNFSGNRVFAVNRAGDEVWKQQMASAPMPPRSFNVHVEYVTVAP